MRNTAFDVTAPLFLNGRISEFRKFVFLIPIYA